MEDSRWLEEEHEQEEDALRPLWSLEAHRDGDGDDGGHNEDHSDGHNDDHSDDHSGGHNDDHSGGRNDVHGDDDHEEHPACTNNNKNYYTTKYEIIETSIQYTIIITHHIQVLGVKKFL